MEKKQQKGKFEKWRDRTFSVLVPSLLGYLALIDRGAPVEVKLLTLLLLAGFATGQAAAIVHRVANAIGRGIVNATSPDQDDEQGNETDSEKSPSESGH
jgi:hypothetical protein